MVVLELNPGCVAVLAMIKFNISSCQTSFYLMTLRLLMSLDKKMFDRIVSDVVNCDIYNAKSGFTRL